MQSFNETRLELFDYIKRFYPDVYNDFNDMSVGTMFIDLISYLNSRLSSSYSSHLQENNVDEAQLYSSLSNIAKKHGINVYGKSASTTLLEISVNLPVRGDAPDLTYAPIIVRGAQFTGGGQFFETIYDVDFSNPFSKNGSPNRTITPIYVNNVIQYYKVTKTEIVVNGLSKFYTKEITINESKPFYELILPDSDILQVTDIITKPGRGLNRTPSLEDLYDDNLRWYKVDNLAQQRVFTYKNQVTSGGAIRFLGDWKTVTKRYVTEYTDKFFLKIKFGGGKLVETQIEGKYQSLINEMLDRSNVQSMGSTLEPNHTLFVKYRIGGGKKSNVGAGTINSIGTANIFINGASNQINTSVRQSITVTNPIPAFGGNDQPSLEDLRNLVKRVGNPSNTYITTADYESLLFTMEPEFGRPYKINSTIIDNKNIINILTLDSNNKLSLSIPTILSQNVSNFLKGKKNPSTYIEIRPTNVINYGLDIVLYIDNNISRLDIENTIYNKIITWSNVENKNIGENINITEVESLIGSTTGVISLQSLQVKYKTGSNYSLSVPQIGVDSNLNINVLNKVLYANFDEIYEIRNPQTDIKITFV